MLESFCLLRLYHRIATNEAGSAEHAIEKWNTIETILKSLFYPNQKDEDIIELSTTQSNSKLKRISIDVSSWNVFTKRFAFKNNSIR